MYIKVWTTIIPIVLLSGSWWLFCTNMAQISEPIARMFIEPKTEVIVTAVMNLYLGATAAEIKSPTMGGKT